ncbi:MAG: hypothetical protein JWM32_2081 [Verrucomicrobia bacterium]|nr:hypothetical protein [Verrucomicrobiota bacterium]
MDSKSPLVPRWRTVLTGIRWEPMFALLAAAAISFALPESLSVGPSWLLLVLVLLLLIPTIISHQVGEHSWNHFFGIVANAVVTAGLGGSLVLLVYALPARRDTPAMLLTSAFLLWLSNILTFALWYWRLDGGGPVVRHSHAPYGSRAFFFPQLQIESGERKQMGAERWTPEFVDYLFVAFNLSTAFSPTDTLVLSRWAKVLAMLQSLISLAIVILLVARGINVL